MSAAADSRALFPGAHAEGTSARESRAAVGLRVLAVAEVWAQLLEGSDALLDQVVQRIDEVGWDPFAMTFPEIAAEIARAAAQLSLEVGRHGQATADSG
jgi:hypothetical protein